MSSTQKLSPNFSSDKNIFLKSYRISGIEVDICPVSGGIWFDRFEIKNFDESHEDIRVLLNALPKEPMPAEVKVGRRSPVHPQAIMQQQPFGPKGMNGVLIIDVCPVSAGIWLDYSEIQKIRELYPNESDRERCVQDFVNNAFTAKAEISPHSKFGLSKLILKLSE